MGLYLYAKIKNNQTVIREVKKKKKKKENFKASFCCFGTHTKPTLIFAMLCFFFNASSLPWRILLGSANYSLVHLLFTGH